MSIFAYTGLPGSGKTYSTVVNQVLPALKLGRRVCTNIPLNRDAIRAVVTTGEIVDFPMEQIAQAPELIEDYATAGTVLILDEVYKLWPSGQKVNQVPTPFKTVLAEHRHRVDSLGNSMQIVLVTQDVAQIGMFARQLIEQTIHHTKLTHMGSEQTYRADIYRGPVGGSNPNVQNRIREVFGRYEKKNFAMYVSHTRAAAGTLGATGTINETVVDTRGNVWKRPSIIVGALFVLFCLVWGSYTLLRIGRDGIADVSGATAGNTSPSVLARPLGFLSLGGMSAGSEGNLRPEYRLIGWTVLGDNGDGVAWIELASERIVKVDLGSCYVSTDSRPTECIYKNAVVDSRGVRDRLITRDVGPPIGPAALARLD